MGRNKVSISVAADTAQAVQQINNFSSELNRSKRSVRDLTAAYEQLDDKTKNSSIGRQMQTDLNSAINRYREMSSIQNKVKENLDSVSSAANGTNNSVNTLGGGISNLTGLFSSNDSALGSLGGTVGKFAGFLGVATSAGALFNEMMDNSQTLGDAVERAQTQAGNAVDYFAQCITQCDFSNFLDGLRSAIDEAGKLADVLDDLATRQLNLGLSDAKFNYQKQQLMTQYRGTNDKKKRKQILGQLDKLTEENAKEIADVAKRSFKASNQLVRSKIQGRMGKVRVTDDAINSYFRDPNKGNELGGNTIKKLDVLNRKRNIINNKLRGTTHGRSSIDYGDDSSIDPKTRQKLLSEQNKIDRQIAKLKKTRGYLYYQISQMQDRNENDPYTKAVNLRKDYYGGLTNAEQQRTMNARLRSQLERGNGGSGGTSHGGGTRHTPKVNRTVTNTEVFTPGSIAAMNQEVRQLQKERDNLADPTKIAAVDAKIQSIKDNIEALNYSAKMIDFHKVFGDTSSIQNQLSKSGLEPIKSVLGDQKIKFDVDSTDLKNVGDAISEWVEKMKEADPKFQLMKEQIESIGQAAKDAFSNFGGDMSYYTDMFTSLGKVFASDANGATKAGAGLSVMGEMLKQIAGDGEAAKAGAMLAAIGQIMLGFANASVLAAALGPFGWIAWLGTGLAAMATAISTIQSFNDGGIVNGSTTTGDNTLVRVNSGEMVLNNRQQARLFKMLDGGLSLNTTSTGGTVDFRISGSNLYGSLKNYSNMSKKHGKITGIS
nr:MAG TPA: Putative tail length tape measure protein [Caudoviricetes sp.]